MPGILYVVATPIGNLEDITYRAVRILGEVDRIACEDTRQTRKLLDHYGIQTALVSYHEHNEAERAAELVEELTGGRSVALVSDAGTPLVSDPGYRVVHQALEAGIRVVPVPGASAALTGLAASGLASHAFCFWGFLPAKAGQRRKVLEQIRALEGTQIFYEAPHRILEALTDVAEVLGRRPVVAARELTKMHEEFLRGSAAEVRETLASRDSIRGEFTLLIGPGEGASAESDLPVAEQVQACMDSGLSRMDAIKEVARRTGQGKREVYRALEEEG